MATTRAPQPADRTKRYEEKRERIIHAAAALINDLGVRSMTFVDVARRVDLNTTSITYYFKRKELLAEAAFELSMEALETIVQAAESEKEPRDRVAKFVELELERWAGVRSRRLPRFAQLAEVRTMDDPVRARLGARFVGILRRIRRLFGPDGDARTKARNVVRTHILLENMFWMPVWLANYSNDDFPRIHGRIMDVFDGGIAGDAAWRPRELKLPEPLDDPDQSGPEAFLRAATRLINQRGYRGASVDRIASELDVTKGSFYHHLKTKDDLVLQCFERSYERITEIQRAALALDAPSLDRAASAVQALIELQLFGDFPLMRMSALQALPPELRARPNVRSNRVANRFSGMLIDGMGDGSIRPVDPAVASQMMMVAINTCYELRNWASDQDQDVAIAMYVDTIARGMFDAKA